MSQSTPVAFYTSLKVFGYVVLGLMVVTILYSGVNVLLNWSEIAV